MNNKADMISVTLEDCAPLINDISACLAGQHLAHVINATAYLCGCAIVMIDDDPIFRQELLNQVCDLMQLNVRMETRFVERKR